MNELDWPKAKAHFDLVVLGYEGLKAKHGNSISMLIAKAFGPMLVRYNKGERTEELYREMMEIE